MKKHIFNEKIISGMIFDLDGTLIRSVVDFPKMKRQMIGYIRDLKLMEIEYTEQQTTNEIISGFNRKMVEHGITESDREKILVQVSEILTEVEFENVGKVELLPGVKEFLKFAENNGIKLGILTRASEKYTKECLKRMGILKYFNPVTTRDDFTLLRAKPHLDSLNHVLLRMQLLPENVIFVGDHSIDFMCAQKSNIRFVGIIPEGNDKYNLNKLDYWKLVKSYNELMELISSINALKLGFLINPIAGMGGRVGLKGTDGVLLEAISRGAKPVAEERSLAAMKKVVEVVKSISKANKLNLRTIHWYTCSGVMGFDVLKKAKISKLENMSIKIIYELSGKETTTNDTKNACKAFEAECVDLIIFCGGDGTARDIYSVVKDRILLLGIPSGVKMHSGVFANHTNVIGEILMDFITGELDTADAEILDLDEDQYRAGEWNIGLFGVAKTPYDPSLIQRGKHMVESASEDEIKAEIAEFIEEEMGENPKTLFILGSGSTVHAITKNLGLDGTVLGIDAVVDKKLIAQDLNENGLLELLDKYPKAKLILSPIGAQGFILGRGNLQLSPRVINKIGLDNIEVVSTPAKLENLDQLRVDNNDPDLDLAFEKKGWLKVIFGYRQMRLKRLGR